MAEFMKTGKSTPADAEAQLSNIRCPALVVMGTLDPDWADPRAEGDAIAAAMPPGLGEVATVAAPGTTRTRSRRMRWPRWSSPSSSSTLVPSAAYASWTDQWLRRRRPP